VWLAICGKEENMKTNGKRNRKRYVRQSLLCTVFSMVLAYVFVTYVSAAGSKPFLQGYYVRDGYLLAHCASLADIEGVTDSWQFSATISGRECPVLEVSTLEEMGEAATYYCLVDVSGSMRQEQMEAAREVLSAICQGMGERDNMVVGALGTTLEVSGFLTDRVEIEAEIEALTADSDYTAIYDAVIDSVAALQSSKECNDKKCLVIISDGDDETVIGKTRGEALRVIEESRIPVYTVAALRQSHTEQQRESAKNLGAFARQSVGGRDYATVVNGYSAQEAGQFILEDMQSGLILKLDASQADFSRDEALLSVRLEMDHAVYSDDMYVYTAELSAVLGEEETETSTEEKISDVLEPTEEPLPEPPIPGKWLSRSVILAAAAVVAVLLLLCVMAVLHRRKRREREQEEREAGERAQREQEEREARERARKQQLRSESEQAGQKMPSGLIGAQTVGAAPGVWYEVRFVAIDHEDIVFTLKIPEGKAVTIGRNNKADMVFNPNDMRLSSVQCRLYCVQDCMNVWDMDSRNDTFVNGVPIHKIGMVTVQNGDVMRMGSYEYRVLITRQ